MVDWTFGLGLLVIIDTGVAFNFVVVRPAACSFYPSYDIFIQLEAPSGRKIKKKYRE